MVHMFRCAAGQKRERERSRRKLQPIFRITDGGSSNKKQSCHLIKLCFCYRLLAFNSHIIIVLHSTHTHTHAASYIHKINMDSKFEQIFLGEDSKSDERALTDMSYWKSFIRNNKQPHPLSHSLTHSLSVICNRLVHTETHTQPFIKQK